jgi:hypothetical protein
MPTSLSLCCYSQEWFACPLFSSSTDASPGRTSFYSPNWASNKDGVIDLLVKPQRWTAIHWSLFWIFECSPSRVDYEVRLNAPGFRPARIALKTLLFTAEMKGNRPVSESEIKRGFGYDNNFDVLHAKMTLVR